MSEISSFENSCLSMVGELRSLKNAKYNGKVDFSIDMNQGGIFRMTQTLHKHMKVPKAQIIEERT